MARVTLSGLVSNIVGKINGTVFQGSQGGLVMRNQSGKINSNTIRSNKRKVGMATIQGEWQKLTNNERTLWQTYAIYLNKKQKHNPSLFVNGHQLFISINSIRYDLSPDNSLFQPYLLSTPILTPLPQPINITSINRNGLALELNLDRTINNLTEVIICYLSRPLWASQTTAYTKTILMKAPTNSGNNFECNAYYVDVYGRIIEVGEYVQTRIAIYSTVSQNSSSYSVNRFEVI